MPSMGSRILEAVPIGAGTHLDGKFFVWLRQKLLKSVRIPASFFLARQKNFSRQSAYRHLLVQLLRDELEELRDKLLTRPEVKIAGFVCDGKVDLRKDIVSRAEEVELETGTEIHLFSFDEWIDFEIRDLNKEQKDRLGFRWLVAVVESFAQKRLGAAPIDEPCDAWINDLIKIME